MAPAGKYMRIVLAIIGFLCASAASAQSVTYTVQGDSVNGSFDYNASTNVASNVDLTVIANGTTTRITNTFPRPNFPDWILFANAAWPSGAVSYPGVALEFIGLEDGEYPTEGTSQEDAVVQSAGSISVVSVQISAAPAVANSGGDNSGGEASVVQSDAVRQLSSQIRSTQRLVRESRDRFITSRSQMAGDSAGIASRNMVPFDVDGSLSVNNATVSSRGTFFGQSGNFEGTSRRLVFGDFDIQRDNDTDSTTAALDGRIAWERMVSNDTLRGYFLGANLGRSEIGGTFTGTQTSYGVSAGGYIVSALQEDLFFDGFVTLGAGRNDLELADGSVDLSSDYTTRTATIGASLTGVIAREGYEIRPELAVSYGYTDLGTIGLTDRAASVDNEVIVDADYVSIANLTFRPEFLVPLDGMTVAESGSLFTFAPRLVCEQIRTAVTTEVCGGGAEFGLRSMSDDGMSNIEFRILADRVGSSTRSSFALNHEHRF